MPMWVWAAAGPRHSRAQRSTHATQVTPPASVTFGEKVAPGKAPVRKPEQAFRTHGRDTYTKQHEKYGGAFSTHRRDAYNHKIRKAKATKTYSGRRAHTDGCLHKTTQAKQQKYDGRFANAEGAHMNTTIHDL